jgi:hypothetical protein
MKLNSSQDILVSFCLVYSILRIVFFVFFLLISWNLIEKFRMNRNWKLDEIYFGLLCILKRHDIYIDYYGRNYTKSTSLRNNQNTMDSLPFYCFDFVSQKIYKE